MQLDSAKLRTYSAFKTKNNDGTLSRNITDRVSMSKFRLSNHLLMIVGSRKA